MMRRLCLTIIVAMSFAGCRRSTRFNTVELALAAAASDSLTVALADSISESRGYVARQSGSNADGLAACVDHVDSRDWEYVRSPIIELPVPPGFTGSGQTSQIATWNGPTGYIRASAHSSDPHTGWTGEITSECDAYISGPAHIDLVTTSYGRGVHVLIKMTNAPAIGIEAQSKTVDGQAQLLHAIRSARVSSSWGRP